MKDSKFMKNLVFVRWTHLGLGEGEIQARLNVKEYRPRWQPYRSRAKDLYATYVHMSSSLEPLSGVPAISQNRLLRIYLKNVSVLPPIAEWRLCAHRHVDGRVNAERCILGRKGPPGSLHHHPIRGADVAVGDELVVGAAVCPRVVGLAHVQEVRRQIPGHDLASVGEDVCGEQAESENACQNAEMVASSEPKWDWQNSQRPHLRTEQHM